MIRNRIATGAAVLAALFVLPGCSDAPSGADVPGTPDAPSNVPGVTITKCEMKKLDGGVIATETVEVEARYDGRATDYTYLMVGVDVNDKTPDQRPGQTRIRLDVDGSNPVVENVDVPVGSKPITPVCVVTSVEGRNG
jgi:hypothetical protein